MAVRITRLRTVALPISPVVLSPPRRETRDQGDRLAREVSPRPRGAAHVRPKKAHRVVEPTFPDHARGPSMNRKLLQVCVSLLALVTTKSFAEDLATYVARCKTEVGFTTLPAMNCR